MKVLQTIVTLLLLSCGLGASVDPYDIVVVEDPTNGTVLLRSTIPVKHDAHLELYSRTEQVIYRLDIPAGTFLNRRVRKSAIPVDAYLLIITDELGRTEIPLTISRSGIVFGVTKAKRTVFPKVDLRDERILVVNYTNESGKRVNVRLTNEDGREVFADHADGLTIRRSYQLKQLEAGNYTVTVSSRSVKSYTAAIALQ